MSGRKSEKGVKPMLASEASMHTEKRKSWRRYIRSNSFWLRRRLVDLGPRPLGHAAATPTLERTRVMFGIAKVSILLDRLAERVGNGARHLRSGFLAECCLLGVHLVLCVRLFHDFLGELHPSVGNVEYSAWPLNGGASMARLLNIHLDALGLRFESRLVNNSQGFEFVVWPIESGVGANSEVTMRIVGKEEVQVCFEAMDERVGGPEKDGFIHGLQHPRDLWESMPE
ncbi:hypothetical protein C8R44DRAFT_749665 [Mycena epipterygia]|nr:hypothetical protein C8R44DRAFT_749665 [Mycena epipterygia]